MSRRLFNFVHRSKVLVLVAVLVLFAGVGTLIAQNPTSTAGMLNQILAAVGVLQTSVNDVQNSVNPANEVNFRFTPPIRPAEEGSIGCNSVNVSDTSHRILMQLFNFSGALVATNASSLGVVPTFGPGGTSSVAIPGQGNHFCKFTALDNGRTKADFRGAVYHYPPTGGVVVLAAE